MNKDLKHLLELLVEKGIYFFQDDKVIEIRTNEIEDYIFITGYLSQIIGKCYTVGGKDSLCVIKIDLETR